MEKVSPHSTYDASISLPLITITFAACACNKHFDDNQALSQNLMCKNQQKYPKRRKKKHPKMKSQPQLTDIVLAKLFQHQHHFTKIEENEKNYRKT